MYFALKIKAGEDFTSSLPRDSYMRKYLELQEDEFSNGGEPYSLVFTVDLEEFDFSNSIAIVCHSATT